jgi:vacuolar-type H+-ATPase subunit H
MMKKIFGIGGEEGVDTLPLIKKSFENLFTIYERFQNLLELSAYTAEDENGRRIRQTFPMSNKIDQLTMLKEQFKEEKRHYMGLQSTDLEKSSPSLKAEYFSKQDFSTKKSRKEAIAHGEERCWPNSSDDNRVKIFTQKVDQICSLMNLRENFEVQMKKYGAARCDFENKVIKIEVEVSYKII